MTTQIFDGMITSGGVVAPLGTTDDAYVSKNAAVASTSSVAIFGIGAHHNVNVYGSVAGNGSGISLGDDSTDDFLERVFVGREGSVTSDNNVGVAMTGISNILENHGIVSGFFGVSMVGDDPNDANTTTLRNFGTIHGSHAGIIRVGDEGFILTNKGEISSDSGAAFVGFDASGVETIVNQGKIIGDVLFGTGNDSYQSKGTATVDGLISGNAGNDKLTGGKAVELLRGDGGHDVLTGNGGADHFILADIGDSTRAKSGRDLITDFSHEQHDRVDLQTIDAKPDTLGDDRFKFIGDHGFDGHAGELRFDFVHGNTFLNADVDGDRHADFSIELVGKLDLAKDDFLL
jgi:chitinase